MLVTWQDALDFLYQRANWEAVPAGPQTEFKLQRIRALLNDLGRPQLRWPAVHIAGTNGKGSTCCLVASALQAAGRRVGLYTSPHLHTVRERVQVNGAPISEAAVLAWLNGRRGILDAHEGLTTFELLTAMAFDYFAAREVDVAVVEVGLGGRLDTTNVVAPAVSVFTAIDLDHTAVLGPTLEHIATDKAGIIKPGVPVVSAEQADGARHILAQAALAAASPLTLVGRDVTFSAAAGPGATQRVAVTVAGERAPAYQPAVRLLGAHQAGNVATAVAVVEVLRAVGWQLDRLAMTAGLEAAHWPARYERLARRPALVVDAAHNPHGARALANTLARHDPGRRTLLLGLSADKDADGILAALLPGTHRVLAARADHPRAMAAADVARLVAQRGWPAEEAASPAAALDKALAEAVAEDVIVAAGSVFLAAEVREAWATRGGMPMPPRDPPLALRRDVSGAGPVHGRVRRGEPSSDEGRTLGSRDRRRGR